MTNRDWYDDSDYENAVERAERMTRIGWKAITGVTGLMVVTAITAAVFCMVVVVGMVYIVAVAL
ncbi:hypothetical protein [Streptomyces venetus]